MCRRLMPSFILPMGQKRDLVQCNMGKFVDFKANMNCCRVLLLVLGKCPKIAPMWEKETINGLMINGVMEISTGLKILRP